jgi:hypothetical protein
MCASRLAFTCFACGSSAEGTPWRELVEDEGWEQTVLIISYPGSLAPPAPKTFRTCGPDCTDDVRERYDAHSTVNPQAERIMRSDH